MCANLLKYKSLVLLPVESLPRRHIFSPVTPVEDEDSYRRFVVGKRCEEIALEIASLIGSETGSWCLYLARASGR